MKASMTVSSSSNVSSHKSAASFPSPPHLAFSPKIATSFLPKNALPLTCHVVSHSLSHRLSPMLHPLYSPRPPHYIGLHMYVLGYSYHSFQRRYDCHKIVTSARCALLERCQLLRTSRVNPSRSWRTPKQLLPDSKRPCLPEQGKIMGLSRAP